jgi:hypothetical protein
MVGAHPSDLTTPASPAASDAAMLPLAVPIVPGKLDQWRAVMRDLAGPRRAEWQAQRRQLQMRERIFLQHTPNGALAIVVLEGRDLPSAMHAIGTANDEFSRWLRQQVLETEGLDLAAPPPGPLPELVADSGALEI